MQWQVIIALAIAIPVILFPVALVWFLNLGGLIQAAQAARQAKAAGEKKLGTVATK